METQNKTGQKKPTLEMSLEGMKDIEDEIGQWMILEEHWTQNGLDRRQQLDYARQIYTRLKAKIASAYSTCPAYSEI
jgi:hypothetical protein